MIRKSWVGAVAVLSFFVASQAFGSSGAESGGHNYAVSLLWIGVVILVAKLFSLVERVGQPSVLGELLAGVILGNLGLLGFHFFEGMREDVFLPFLAELGVIILLFQVGLESNIAEMKKVGSRALAVAIIGVVAPFVLGTYLLGPVIMPGLSQNAYLFLGATLTATSVGITARVFRDLNKLQLPEAKIVLGAAVIDDVIGLIILAVVSAIVVSGMVSLSMVGVITLKAIGFLVGAIILGQIVAPFLGRFLSSIHSGIGMKLTLALSFALLFSWAAGQIGLAPIIGAFAAGLVLDPVHFVRFKKPQIIEEMLLQANRHPDKEAAAKLVRLADSQADRHVEDLIEPIGHFLVPIFFVMTGFGVRLETLFNWQILGMALAVTLVAFVGKLLSGLAAGDVNKWLVGFGMVPRGEVGLIFATIGKSLGVVNDSLYSVIVIVVILSTLLTPPILIRLLKQQKEKGEVVSRQEPALA